MNDPLYQNNRFWSLPCHYLLKVLESTQKIEKERIQAESVTSAYLADSIHAIATAVWGGGGSKYKSNPSAYLPFQDTEKDEEMALELDQTTLDILLTEIKNNRINSMIVAHFSSLLPQWIKK